MTRAYQAWDSLTLPQSIDGLQLDSTELSLKMAMDDGKAFLGDVTGYDDHASKVLANSVATFNADLGMANVMFTLSGEIERDQAVTVMTSLEQVRMDYLAWRKATCL